MIRTLIFGAIAGYVGKKLYDEGKLTEFKDDLVSRYHQVRDDISARSAGSGASDLRSPGITPMPPRPSASSAPIAS
ncbi:MAG TPA: hypothetical protein VJ762_09255 [Sphingobium sp.]|nr:hypothetical protein [Sphingobium sp.]